ncbi:porin [beta proteobacterium CB]|nr:porin [beta proteobacterium CB]
MKKSLLAVAAIGAFASAAQAQSSVTVYGIIDAGFSSTSSRNGTNKATNAGFIQNGNGNETSSRLGFKGTEDLGGGTSAFFTAELELSNASSTQVLNGNRQTFVGLKKNGIGQGAIGTQYTLTHDAVAATDPGQSNNVVGSVIRPVAGASTASSVLGSDSAGGNHMVRSTNMIKFNSDKFAGFGLNAAYIQNNVNTNQTATGTNTVTGTGGTANFNGWNVSADYTWQKLYVAAAYASVKQEQNALIGTTAATITTPSTITAAVNPNTTTNNTYAGATYDFGILKAYAGWTNAKITNDYNSSQYLKRTGQQLGVRAMLTPKIEGWASAGNGRFTNYGVGTPTTNFNAWQLGSNYLLSKRTNLYAIYGQTIFSSSSAGGLTPSGAASSQYAMGVRHTF